MPVDPLRRRAWLAAIATLAVLAVPACARTPPKTVADAAPLEVPGAPPREVAPTEPDAPAPLPLPAEPAHLTPPRTTPRPTAPARPATPPAEAAKPASEDTQRTPPSLQTTPSSAQTEVERLVRTQLGRATADLARVDVARLGSDARVQYETARRFVAQADEALRDRNLVFARNLAEKAATLAAALPKR